MLTINAGSICSLPLYDSGDGSYTESSSPWAVQFLGVLKLRRYTRFNLQAINDLKKANASEGGAASGGYLLSSLAIDPHSLIILSTSPIIVSTFGSDSFFVFYCPKASFPTYKGDSFDVEYVLVRKRLSDGHLELLVVRMTSSDFIEKAIQFSRDCPATVALFESPNELVVEFSVESLKRQLRNRELISSDRLEIIRRQLNDFHGDSKGCFMKKYSVKGDDAAEVAHVIVQASNDCPTVKVLFLTLSGATSTLKADIFRCEIISTPFSSNSGYASNQLIYRKEYDRIGMIRELELEDLPTCDLPNVTPFSSILCSVKWTLTLHFDALSCSFDILFI